MPKVVHKGITPARVVDAAFQIVDTDGEAALTMRRLGRELGVAAMAIYNHYRDRDAILDAIAERALAGLLTTSEPAPVRDRIRRLVATVHTLAEKHPRIFELVVNRPNRPKAFFPLMTESLDALAQAGLDRKSAVQWYHTFLMLIHGYATWRSSLVRHAHAAPNPADHGDLTPAQIEDWRAVHSVSAEAQFDHAINLLLNTLEAQSQRSSKSKT